MTVVTLLAMWLKSVTDSTTCASFRARSDSLAMLTTAIGSCGPALLLGVLIRGWCYEAPSEKRGSLNKVASISGGGARQRPGVSPGALSRPQLPYRVLTDIRPGEGYDRPPYSRELDFLEYSRIPRSDLPTP